jgi:hypothetical protein
MTSLTVPVLKDGKFAGITGVDMNLPIFEDGHRQAGHQHLLASANLVEVGFHQAGATSLATAEIPLAVANAEFIARGVELGVTGGGIYGLLRDVSVLFPGEIDLETALAG